MGLLADANDAIDIKQKEAALKKHEEEVKQQEQEQEQTDIA